MFGLRMPELLIIVGVLLLVFGAKRLPELGAGLGGAIRGFKRGLSEGDGKDAGSLPKDDSRA
jgi:sec-independent protein translocase protein TatA